MVRVGLGLQLVAVLSGLSGAGIQMPTLIVSATSCCLFASTSSKDGLMRPLDVGFADGIVPKESRPRLSTGNSNVISNRRLNLRWTSHDAHFEISGEVD